MSDFLMIVPEGWEELVNAQEFIDQHSEETLLALMSRNEGWAAIEALLQDGGFIPINALMLDFRLFRDGSTNRIWYRLG